MDTYEMKRPEPVVGSGRRFPKKFLLVILVIFLLLGGAYWYFMPKRDAVPVMPTPRLSLSEASKSVYAEAATLRESGDYAGAIARLDSAIAELGTTASSSVENRYADAKFQIYKADIYLSGTHEYEKGFDLLYQVYSDLRYDDSVAGEAMMLAMAYAVQALDEGALTLAGVDSFLFKANTFANVVGGAASSTAATDRAGIDARLTYGFKRAIQLTSSEEVYRLSQSYILRLTAPYLSPEDHAASYEFFRYDMMQFESDMDVITKGFVELGEPYEEFIATSFYNLLRAYEGLIPKEGDFVEAMQRVDGKLEAYIAQHPDSGNISAAYRLSAHARIACRIVDAARFDKTNIDATRLAPHLDAILLGGEPVVPCPEAFTFIAEEIDSRFAPYF